MPGGPQCTIYCGDVVSPTCFATKQSTKRIGTHEKSSRDGGPSCNLVLDSFYENPSSQLPHISGLNPTPSESRRLTITLAASGDNAAKAYLARYYYEGFGGEQNVGKAAKLLQEVFSDESTYCPHAEQYYWQWKRLARNGDATAQEFIREFTAIGGKEPPSRIKDPSLR